MSNLTNADFMSPYEVSKYLEGVIPGLKAIRTTFLQDQFGDKGTTEAPTLNLDKERDEKNIIGQYVHPKADAGYIQLPDFGHQELAFAYAKEGIQTDDFETLNQRELGQPFGMIDVNANDASRLQRKLINALNAFSNLREKAAADILVYGAHTASGPKASTVTWDFGRTKVTTETGYQDGYCPEIDLTTVNSGSHAWSAGGGKPYEDIKKIMMTAKRRNALGGKIVMSLDAYDLLEADINANYSEASDLTLLVQQRIETKILPYASNYNDLTFQRSLPIGGGNAMMVDIYTYDGRYNDRITGVATKYWPDGYVVYIPPASNNIIRYGRIKHRKARWQAMPVWINTWEDGKSGEFEQELHTSFVLAPLDIDSVISWKVK